jgi:hypothetical protein
MKLLSRTHDSGTIQIERTLRQQTGEKKILKRESRTEGLGPFSREEIHARVGATVGATLSRNYHAVNVSVTINIPTHATDDGVAQGLTWVFDRANLELNSQLEGANKALDRMSKSKRE